MEDYIARKCEEAYARIDELCNDIYDGEQSLRSTPPQRQVICRYPRRRPRVFNSVGEAARALGVSKSAVSRCCNGDRVRTVRGHICEFGDVVSVPSSPRPIVARSEDGEEVTFTSISVAARILNADKAHVRRCCNGKRNITVRGYTCEPIFE